MGPWTHAGLMDNSVGNHRHGAPSRFRSCAHILHFIEQTFEGAHTGRPERRQQAQCWQGQDDPASGSGPDCATVGAVPEGGAIGGTKAQPEAAAIAARALAPSPAPTMPLSASASNIRLPSLAILLLKRLDPELAYIHHCPRPISNSSPESCMQPSEAS